MESEVSEATPRPWCYKYGDSFDHGEDRETNGFEILMAGADPRNTGRCQVIHRIRYAEDVFPEDAGYKEAEANAALIVCAVNCHDELVAVLEAICDDDTTPMRDDYYKQARAALSRARGET